MATLGGNAEADSGPALLRVFLTISAVWLVFWAFIGAVFFTFAGSGVGLIAEVRVLCLAVFAPPAALLTIGLISAEALSRSAANPKRALTRTIGIEQEETGV